MPPLPVPGKIPKIIATSRLISAEAKTERNRIAAEKTDLNREKFDFERDRLDKAAGAAASSDALGPVTRDERRRMVARVIRGAETPPSVLLAAVELDAVLAGEIAPERPTRIMPEDAMAAEIAREVARGAPDT